MADKAALAAKQRAYRAAHPERVRATKRRQYIKYREQIIAKAVEYAAANKEAVKARLAAWRARNIERQAERDRLYYQANKERISERYARYAAANPDTLRVRDNNRRARLLSAEGKHTPADIREIGEAQRWLCVYCRTDIKAANHLDHILPLKLGGSNDRTNLQLLCKSCNLRKGAKHPSAFRAAEIHHG